MATGLWKDDYRLGIGWLDDQHRAICGLVERLMAAVDAKSAQPAVGAVLDELNARLAEHFRDEEKYLREAGCAEADVAGHADAHKDVRFIIDNASATWRRSPPGADGSTELSNLCRWVWLELVDADMALARKPRSEP